MKIAINIVELVHHTCSIRLGRVDGALYRTGRKDIGRYARFTATDEQLAGAEFEQALRNLERASPAKSGGKAASGATRISYRDTARPAAERLNS